MFIDFKTLTKKELRKLSDINERDARRFERRLEATTCPREARELHILCNKIWNKIRLIERIKNQDV